MESMIKAIQELKEEGMPIAFQNDIMNHYYIKRESISNATGTITETYVVTKNGKQIGTVEMILWNAKVHGDPICNDVYKYFTRCILYRLADAEYRQAAEDRWASKNKTE